jgi:hypothetical protein
LGLRGQRWKQRYEKDRGCDCSGADRHEFEAMHKSTGRILAE